MKQTIRDQVTGDLSIEYFAKRLSEGWKVASVEWVRESAASEAALPVERSSLLSDSSSIPYGLQLTGEGFLEENPLEATVLLLILDQIVREKRIQEIATELNTQGYATRGGTPWRATDVFNLLPRLIDAGPALLKSATWQQRKQNPPQMPV